MLRTKCDEVVHWGRVVSLDVSSEELPSYVECVTVADQGTLQDERDVPCEKPIASNPPLSSVTFASCSAATSSCSFTFPNYPLSHQAS